jgi:hypothetical protein
VPEVLEPDRDVHYWSAMVSARFGPGIDLDAIKV